MYMHSKMRILAASAALALPLLLAAGSAPPPPELQMPPGQARQLTITGQGLTIKPGLLKMRRSGEVQMYPWFRNWLDGEALLNAYKQNKNKSRFENESLYLVRSTVRPVLEQSPTYMKFSGPVTVNGPDLVLRASIVELEVLGSEVTGGKAPELPQLSEKSESAEQDPAKAASEIAQELKMPQARFSQSALRRISASGNVTVTAKDANIETPQIISLDGGYTWSASGGCTLTRHDAKTGERYSLHADVLVYDARNLRAVGAGRISGSFTRGDKPPLEIEATQCAVDLDKKTLVIAQPLTLRYQNIVLTCGSLTADLLSGKLNAGGEPKIESPERNLSMSSAAISVDLEQKIITAEGGVEVSDTGQGVTLKSEKLRADLADDNNRVYVATGHPELHKGASVFKGDTITLRQTVVKIDGEEREKLIVEVDGKQESRLGMQDIRDLEQPRNTGRKQRP